MPAAPMKPRISWEANRRERLVDAAAQVLTDTGFSGATTRAIAARADCNVGLISYYFGGVNNLLLEALDRSSTQRLHHYQAALADASTTKELRRRAVHLYREDQVTGHVKLLSEMVAGGLMDRHLGKAVAARVEPWVELTEAAVRRAMPAPLRRRTPVREIAYAIVAMFLGLEMLGSLTGDHTHGQRIVERLASTLWLTKTNTTGS